MSNKKNFHIAISGKSGCGNTTVSHLVGEKLGFAVVNYTFRNVAREKGMNFADFCQMAEKDEQWDRYVDTKQVELARKESSVLGSRLALWMMEEADLKVYLTASPEVRALRIYQREGGNAEEKLRETRQRDQRDHSRYLRLYGIDNNKYEFADLLVNTDRLEAEVIAEIICSAVKAIDHPGQKK